MKTVFRIVAIIVILLAFFGSYSFMSMALDREPPVTYEGARAIAPSVESGGSIEVEFKVFRKRICSAAVRRWLTDATGVKHSIPSFTVGLELLAGRETYRRSITIPQAAVVGPASYQVIIDYTCNPLQTFIGPIRVESPPIVFDILPPVEAPPVLKPDSDG